MNHIPVETIASSIPFRFLVGPNQREFTIHSALVSHQSPVLEKLVNGSFSEAAEKCVIWKSVDEDTFNRFWQYTYTGKYTADRPIIGPKSGSKDEEELAELLQKRGKRGILIRKDRERLDHLLETAAYRKEEQSTHEDETPPKELTKHEIQWNVFKHQRASASFGATYSTGLFGGELVRSNQAHEDYTNTFLSHARLYVFAECYNITGLIELSLNELHRTLVTFTLYRERIDDIVALVRYCYENLVPEALREIITLYAACKIEKLWLSEQFQELVEAHGELSKSLIGLMVKVV